MAHWPDITIKNKDENIHIALDVAIPVDRNSTQNEAEKKLKYKGSGIETMNAEHEMHNYTGKYCNHRSGNKRL
jgi:hypothetical protein